MKTVIRNSYTPKIGDYCETIVVDKETEKGYIFDCDGVFTEIPQPVDIEKILEEAAAYTDEQVAPLAEKLDTIEEGAQVNKIEHVLRNGTELTITNKTVNVTVPTKTSDLTNDGSDGTDTYVESAALDDYYTKTETDTQIGYETDAREIADSGLQEQIDAIVASSDVVDIVGTYAALQSYDTSTLSANDIIKVLTDESRDDATTYYRWDGSTWLYIGAEGPFYTKAESDAIFTPMTRTINNKALSSDITLTAQDVGALPDSTVIPTVNDATLTIQKNGTTVQTFTANQASNATANITVPTDTSDLTNDGDGQSPFATEDYVDTYGGKIDTIEVNGIAQPIVNKTVDISVPTKTSDLTNDGSDGTDTYVEAGDLATVATTGDYSDLTNKPTIPTVNDATLTIQKNGTDVATFTANSASAATANITVPTDTSDLTNGAGFITTSALSDYYTKSETYSQQEVNSLINTLSIPTKTSDLTNDGSDGTSSYVEAASLATVATTGDYDDLLNKPTIPTYSDFTGATSSTAGTHGLVPAPAAGDEGKFLQGDGTWATVQSGGTVTTFYWDGTGMYKDSSYSTAATIFDVETAANSGPVRICYMGYGRYEYLVTDSISAGHYFSTVWADVNGNLKSVAYAYYANDWGRNATNIQYELIAGPNISISSGVISASIPIDSALSVSSTNPVENSVITAALNGKQNTLTAGTNITISNDTISAATSTIFYMSAVLNITTTQVTLYSDAARTTAITWSSMQTAILNGAVVLQYTQGSNATQYIVIGVATSNRGVHVLERTANGRYRFIAYLRWSNATTTTATVTIEQLALTTDIGNATLTVTQNGTSVGTFTANSKTNTTLALTDTTYSDMVGASSSTAGTHGLVPAPAAGDDVKYLKGDGSWAAIPSANNISSNDWSALWQ